ncbi:putative baseplate assembly protein [Actinoplanes sp. NPDC049265]|uniref:putative baseplate assembly protein n=1 Tax=Actinoplanes sp. NPDC049265 TaxID=3363902 RepID=UPI00371828DC
MSLPAPELDDRKFQDIVDEAKRRVTALCPEWTDHNVSDPGVALIELFAWMTELMIYRLNQVPDRLYVKFLELVGITLQSAGPARTGLLFRLDGPARDTVVVPRGTRVGTELDEDGDQIVFMTDADLRVAVPELVACRTHGVGQDNDHTGELRAGDARILVFPGVARDDALCLGLRADHGGNLLRVDLTVSGAHGAGIDPDHPPIAWQSWTGRDWQDVRLLADTTGGLNRSGRVEMLLAPGHPELSLGGVAAHWLRCVLRPVEGHAGYRSSPMVQTLTVAGHGGLVMAHHAETAPGEVLGVSNGRPGQSFFVRRAPALTRTDDETVLVVPDNGAGEPQKWTEVATFAGAGPQDRYVTWCGATGEIRFGPGVTDDRGRVRLYGATPPENAQIRVTGYRYGGGRRGNVGPDTLTVPLSAVPQLRSVTNPEAATGGLDAETLDNARTRGPLALRSADRAVTAADFQRFTTEIAGVARARCLPPESPGEPVRLLVVPAATRPAGPLSLDDLSLPEDLGAEIRSRLDDRRLLSVRVRVGVPRYQGVRVRAVVRAVASAPAEVVGSAAAKALYRFLDPVGGGPGGGGWPFDRPLGIGDVYTVLGAVPGVAAVSSVELVRTDLWGEHDDLPGGQEITLPPAALFLSDRHDVEVAR